MERLYNSIAGHSVERLSALSDGVFAIAMTLLVLDLHVPVGEGIHSERDLWNAIAALAPRFLTYLMSFVTLGIFWVGQQTQLSRITQADRNISWIHIAFLLMVSITPFSTALLGQFIEYRVALLAYWLNILVLGAILFWSWKYVESASLAKPDTPPEFGAAVRRRILVAQGLYAFGAALCVFNTYWSIAVIVLVQLNYALAPRIRALYRL